MNPSEEESKRFRHFPEYKILVCVDCRTAVIPGQWETHIARKHPEMPKSTRKATARRNDSIGMLAATADAVVYPDRTSDRVAGLDVETDGFRCTARLAENEDEECGKIYRRLKHIQAHCRAEHGWTNRRRPGGQTAEQLRELQQANNKPWRSGITFQQFFKTGGFQRLFEVKAGRQSNTNGNSLARAIKRQREEVVEEARKEKEQEKIDGDGSRLLTNKWIRKAGWARHLAGIEREWLLKMTALPDKKKEDDQELVRACGAVEDVVFAAQAASCADVVGWPAMYMMERREMGGGERNSKPFYAEQLEVTISKYAVMWMRVFCYIWRMEAAGADRRKPGYRLTAKQAKALQAVRELIERENNNADDDADDADDADADDADTDDTNNSAGSTGKTNRLSSCATTTERQQVEISLADAQPAHRTVAIRDGRGPGPEGSATSTGLGPGPRRPLIATAVGAAEAGSDDDDKQLQDGMLQFLLALLDDDIKDNEYRNALISALAAWGIDERRGGWKSALQYTPDLSAIVTVGKMLVLYQANRTRTGRIEQLMADGMGRVEAEEAAPAHIDLVQDMASRFVMLTGVGGRPSPMDSVMRLRTFGLAIRNDTAADGTVDWVGDKVLCGTSSFTMGQLRGMVQGLLVRTRRLLLKELMLLEVEGAGRLPAIRWEAIFDNPAELKDGWSFLQDGRNRWDVDGKQWLHERIADEDGLRQQFIGGGDGESSSSGDGNGDGNEQRPVWKADRLKSYAKALDRFRGYLLVLVHVTGGQPGRATELLSIRHANGRDKSGRGVFVENGLVAMVTGYHKGYAKSGRTKIVHRYVPREVGELVVWYLWLVQPFWELVQRIHGVKPDRDAFVWQPKEEEKVKRMYGTEPQPKKRKTAVADDGMQTIIKDKVWNTDRAKHVLGQATQEWMGCRVTIRNWRHIAIAIFRRYIADKQVQEMVNEEDDENNSRERGEHVEDEMHDLAANHSSRTANMMYGRALSESPFETMRRRRGFRAVSEQWHQLLLLESVIGDNKKITEEIRQEAKAEQFRRWRQMGKVDITAQLHGMVGPAAEFRGVQEQALRAIMQQRSPIVVVMGTGGGDGHGRRQEFVVYAAGAVLGRGDGSSSATGVAAAGHGAAV
jgi:hypothetical protein